MQLTFASLIAWDRPLLIVSLWQRLLNYELAFQNDEYVMENCFCKKKTKKHMTLCARNWFQIHDDGKKLRMALMKQNKLGKKKLI